MPTEPTMEDPNAVPEKELLRWSSEDRPFKVRSREFYSTVLVLAALVGVIFFFIEGIMPVLLIAAIVFMIFAVSRTQPGMSEHVFTDKGIYTGGQLYHWEIMHQYWFTNKWGKDMLHILINRWPGQLIMLLPTNDSRLNIETLKKTIGGRLPLEKPADSWFDKAINWINQKVPLDEV